MGWNQVVGAETAAIVEAFERARTGGSEEEEPYGVGWSAWDVLFRVSKGHISSVACG